MSERVTRAITKRERKASDNASITAMEPYIKALPNNTEGVVFLFGPIFSERLREPAERIAARYNVTADVAIEEFRRLLAIKTLIVDNYADKISPNPPMDEMWHAAILDTLFYKDIQVPLKTELRHRPSGASEEERHRRRMRLSTMKNLYTFFFHGSPIEGGEVHEKASTFQIFIKTLSGRTITVIVSPDNTVESIKHAVELQDGTPVEVQRLIFAGKNLEDRHTIGYYNVQKEATLHVVLLIRGC